MRSALGSGLTDSVARTTGRTRVGGAAAPAEGGASRVKSTRRV
jgi:hypothetical protein